jgi:SAM-dependent methyltransferase
MIPIRWRPSVAAAAKYHPLVTGAALRLQRLGLSLMSQARDATMACYLSDAKGDTPDPMRDAPKLQRRIGEVLSRYRQDVTAFKYFHALPYQGLALAGVLGDRMSDYRFDDYELRKWIRPADTILDIGCNCGFMAVLSSYRIGCRAHGIDINPYMVEIGRLVAEHLRVSDLVTLRAGRLQEFQPVDKFDVVLSFATHWTDDNNYRVSLDEHMDRMASYLRSKGTLVFETHCNDVGRDDFYRAMAAVRDRFEFDGCYKKTDAGTRELYIMRKVA